MIQISFIRLDITSRYSLVSTPVIHCPLVLSNYLIPLTVGSIIQIQKIPIVDKYHGDYLEVIPSDFILISTLRPFYYNYRIKMQIIIDPLLVILHFPGIGFEINRAFTHSSIPWSH